MALGGDGMIGLPYWGWEEANINGEVFPKILRERFEKYPVSTLVPPQHRTCLPAAQKLSPRSIEPVSPQQLVSLQYTSNLSLLVL
jgi:hypothetical protein